MFRRLHRTACTFSRVGLTLCVIGGLAAGTVGFTVTPPGLSGGAFPCQGHGCGCQSANDCWFGCCCMSPAQRLAWAKANQIEPPAGLRQLARDKAAAKTNPIAACCANHGTAAYGNDAKCCIEREGEAPAEPHCKVGAKYGSRGSAGASPSRCPATCAKQPASPPTANCCSKSSSSSCCSKKTKQKIATGTSPRSKDRAPSYEPSRCHGLGQWWVTSGQPLGLPERPTALVSLPIAQPVTIGERAYSLDGQAPPTRPG
ncbi:MAG: hypothetical protein M3552_12015 [Planctomycetota bacterium]|nr:hypothetical protein [Planctomycetota bacterium]